MRRLSALVLVLAGAALAGCGSSAPSTRASVVQFIRAREAKAGATHQKFYDVRVSKLDPNYAAATEEFTLRSGGRWTDFWILRRAGSTWRVTSKENYSPVCGAAPPNVMKELLGSAGCDPPVGVYLSLPWTRGHDVRVRYCQRPGGPGNFLAASKGVTCGTASSVIRKVNTRCNFDSSCVVAPFRCRAYYSGKFGGSFNFDSHALCRDGARRILWDGG